MTNLLRFTVHMNSHFATYIKNQWFLYSKIFIWQQHWLFKHEKKSFFDIETLYFDIWFNFISYIFGVTHECFIFFIEQSHHGALHIWSSKICQTSISWHMNQSHVCLVMSNQPKCPNILVSGVTCECNAMIGSTIRSIIAMTIYVTLATSKVWQH